MAAESFLQVAPDSTGKRVRNLQLQVLQADGTVATVLMQVVAIADPEGNPLSFGPDRELMRALNREACLQTDVLLRILAAIEPGEELSREDVIAEMDEQDRVDSDMLGEEP